MKIIKKLWIFVLLLIITFFVNFSTLLFHLRECGFKHWPCFSESFDSPVVTNYLNFFTHTSCGGFAGTCFSGGFSLTILISDIIFALIFFFIILGIIKIFHKTILKPTID